MKHIEFYGVVMKDSIRFQRIRECEVINICTGTRLGCVTDILINKCNGCIEAIIIPKSGKVHCLFGYEEEYIIPYECIKRIGDDLVLVEIQEEHCVKPCK